MNGFLLINKDKGPTSHDVVFKVRKIAKTRKVGHTGTLDPMATGIMVVCIGNTTKAADFISAGDKAYIAEMELGLTSNTLDITGEVTKLPERDFEEMEIRKAFEAFKGDILQIPPMYSAKKIEGQKLYDLARKGIEIERQAVPVTIKKLEIDEINGKNGKNVKFYVLCTKGTYIRSLIDDIGKKLNSRAVMTSLTRVQSGNFSIENAHTIKELSELESIEHLLYPLETAFSDYPKINVTPDIERLIKNGIVIDLKRAGIEINHNDGQIICIYNQENELFALMTLISGRLKLYKSFFTNQRNT